MKSMHTTSKQKFSIIEALPGSQHIELSTRLLMRSAQKRKLRVEVLDDKVNLIRLSGNGKIEYIKQASITSLDSYLSFSCMEDKNISKLLLAQDGLPVVPGSCFASMEEALAKIEDLPSGSLIVKPSTTNFGLGIVKIDHPINREQYKQALQQAFSYAQRVIVEKWVSGKEYRFLVMGKECVAVCCRIAANIIGDGHSTIFELVERKNQDPRRGLNHTSPLEKIQFTNIEKEYLNAQGLDFQSVLDKDKQIFLRPNSNISTGGDSIDYTDDMANTHKQLAIRAAKTVKAKICGVDMILSKNATVSTNTQEPVILELNFNPVLYMHEYPFQGQQRQVCDKLLDLLGF